MRIANHECYRTGDINFFAACMAIGIAPLWQPAETFAVDDGKDYHTFRLSTLSECGLHRTVEMDRAWSNPSEFRAELPDHPFSKLMSFIGYAISKNAKKKTEFITSAATFLTISEDAMRRAMKDVERLVADQGESPLTYIACFIHARFDALTAIKSAIPKEVLNEHEGPGIVMMDGNLSRKQKEFLTRKL